MRTVISSMDINYEFENITLLTIKDETSESYLLKLKTFRDLIYFST